jgi:hypothetical protein
MDQNDTEVGFIREDNALMALLRRVITLIPQSYHCEINGAIACTYKQNWNPFVMKINIDFPEIGQVLDKRLGIAGAILLCAIEGKQSGGGGFGI